LKKSTSAAKRTLEGYDASVSPPPEPFDGASPVTGPEEQEAALDVLENNHFTNEYEPGVSWCHQTFCLPVSG
jgi:hypothetical protein